MAKPKKQKKVKNELVWDNKQREEFLTGFTKRKQQRKKKAAEENEKKLKAEQKRLKDETKNLKDKFKQSFKPIPELDDVLRDTDDEENGFETEDVTVTISTIKPDEMARKNFIGYRKVQESESEEESEEPSDVEIKDVPGMELGKSKKPKAITDKSFEKLTEKLTSEKDVKKLIKQQAKSAMKKSKIIKMKNDQNHKKNVKLSQRKKFRNEKNLRKHKKIPKHKSK